MTEPTPRFADDPERNRSRLALLRKLAAESRDPLTAELANELLRGNVTPREVLGSDRYGEVFAGATRDFSAWYDGLSEQEKDAAAERGRQAERDLAAEDTEPAQPPGRRRGRRPAPGDAEDNSDTVSWLNDDGY